MRDLILLIQTNVIVAGVARVLEFKPKIVDIS
jgi:hypothetical protein